MSGGGPLLTMREVSKAFGASRALDRVSLDLEAGEGPSPDGGDQSLRDPRDGLHPGQVGNGQQDLPFAEALLVLLSRKIIPSRDVRRASRQQETGSS